MAKKIIAEGELWWVEREGPEEFVNFEGTFAEWVAKQLEEES